jgi:hypothetical protein
MRAYCFNILDELAPYSADWDLLSEGVPFRCWTWLSTWWRHYGGDDFNPNARKRLCVVCVFDDADKLIGIAPWYIDRSVAGGSALRMLGSGEVCSDYLGVLCQSGLEESVLAALADFLAENMSGNEPDAVRWNLLELTGIDVEDRFIDGLVEQMSQRGATIHCRSMFNCWRIDLPTAWDAYLAMLSKNRRRKIHRLEREYFTSGRAVLHTVQRSDELHAAMEMLIDFHQRRQRGLRRPGCYASKRFAAFSREVVPLMFRNGQLIFHRMDLDGKPAVAEYLLAGGGILYAYQTGVNPAALEHEPGKLMNLLMIKRAMEQGYMAFDFLRGDEPYKAGFAALARPSLEIRIVPRRAADQLRHKLWLGGASVKKLIKRKLKIGNYGQISVDAP